MTLKSDAKLEVKLTLSSKNYMKNLVNLNDASSGKSENLHFDVLLCQQHIQFQLKEYRRIISHYTKKDPNFEEKLTFCLKNDIRNLVTLTRAVESLKICILMGYFCRKYVMFELKNTEELCREK